MYGTVMVHSGIKGMRWGIRRYQNEDGTLTEEGKIRYSKDEAGKEAAEAAYTYANSDKFGKKLAKALTVGGYGNRQTYNMARAAGEGRAKAFLRSKLDLNVSTLTSHAGKGVIGKVGYSIIKGIADRKTKWLLGIVGSAAGVGSGIAINRIITDELASKGKMSSAQQVLLRNKYYSKKKEPEETEKEKEDEKK